MNRPKPPRWGANFTGWLQFEIPKAERERRQEERYRQNREEAKREEQEQREKEARRG